MDVHKIKPKTKEEWIQKDFKNKIPKLDRRKLFIPSQDELFF